MVAKPIARGTLIVSCQADAGTPLAPPAMIAALAQSALAGGGQGLRVDQPANIAAVRAGCDGLLVGSYKLRSPSTAVYVTPNFDAARQVIDAGADMIGIEATRQPLEDGATTYDLIRRIKAELRAAVMADVSVFDEAVTAQEAGADYVTTAMAGFTPYSRHRDDPDWPLLIAMVEQLQIPVIAEGRIGSPQQAAQALQLGAHAVVVGTAITDAMKITGRYVKAMRMRG